jgi:hypothetical protein
MTIEADELKAFILELRSLCGSYPVRFTADISGIGYSTVNRFVNGDNPKLSTILGLSNAVNECSDLEGKYKKWRKMIKTDYKLKQYKGH